VSGEVPRRCWASIGVMGDGSCPELKTHIHCRNCPVFTLAGRGLFERALAPQKIAAATSRLSCTKASEKPPDASTHVFRVGPEWLGLPSRLLLEIVDPRPVRRIPHRSNEVFLGLTSVRGEIHLCFSMASLLGIEAREGDPTPSSRRPIPHLCLVKKGGSAWGFAADEVHGEHRHCEADIEPLPASVARAAPRFTRGIVTLGEMKVGLLDDDLVFHALERYLA